MGANTLKANVGSTPAVPSNTARASARSNILYPPQITVVTATGAGTYTTPTVNGELPLWLRIRMVGAGGGGGAGGTGGTNGGLGGATTFSTFTANGGAGGVNTPTDYVFPAGGTASGGALNMTGQDGGGGTQFNQFFGPQGGNSFFFGAGQFDIHINTNAAAANPAKANTGSGGGAGMVAAAVPPGNGGAAGAYLESTISSPAASYAYSVGAKGAGGTAGTNGSAGGNGADGIIIIEAYWQ